jgi:hypothetical protein
MLIGDGFKPKEVSKKSKKRSIMNPLKISSRCPKNEK